jgi:hypothetical protein
VGEGWTHSYGYVLVRAAGHPNAHTNGAIYEHRLVASRTLGRPLRRNEVVHHINGDPADNRPKNLEVHESNGAHHRLCHANHVWTAPQSADLVKRWRAKETAPSIARATGRTIDAVRNRIRFLRRRGFDLALGITGGRFRTTCKYGHGCSYSPTGLKYCLTCNKERLRLKRRRQGLKIRRLVDRYEEEVEHGTV